MFVYTASPAHTHCTAYIINYVINVITFLLIWFMPWYLYLKIHTKQSVIGVSV